MQDAEASPNADPHLMAAGCSARATRTAIDRGGCRRRCVDLVPSNIGRDEDDELEVVAKRTRQRSQGG
jgi:hypothetical protein